jgi:hypothetical protein
MSFTKITDQDRQGKGNVGQPDTPDLSTSEMQELLDQLPNMAIDGLNRLIDELEDETSASYIGASVPDGITANANIQSVLTGIAFMLNLCNTAKHTHTNKSTLDQFTDEYKSTVDGLLEIMSGITFATVVSGSSTDSELATAKAVYTAIQNANVNTRAINAAYPIGTVYTTTSLVEPGTTFGVGTWTLLDSEQVGLLTVKRYVRTA